MGDQQHTAIPVIKVAFAQPIYDAAALKEALDGNKAGNYYIENDIDLTILPGDWTGPKGYSGHFNGGGNTIKLQLSQTSGAVGLFSDLAPGAIIENLKVDISTKDNKPLTMKGDSWFGSVVGVLNDSARSKYTIKGVSVKGRLQYGGSSGGYLFVGALIGEIRESQNITLTVDDCQQFSFLFQVIFCTDRDQEILPGFMKDIAQGGLHLVEKHITSSRILPCFPEIPVLQFQYLM